MTIKKHSKVVGHGRRYVSKGENGIHGDVLEVNLACGHTSLFSPCHIPVGTTVRCYKCEDEAKAAR